GVRPIRSTTEEPAVLSRTGQSEEDILYTTELVRIISAARTVSKHAAPRRCRDRVCYTRAPRKCRPRRRRTIQKTYAIAGFGPANGSFDTERRFRCRLPWRYCSF